MEAHTSNETQSMQKKEKQINDIQFSYNVYFIFGFDKKMKRQRKHKPQLSIFLHIHMPHAPSLRANEEKWHISRE